MQFTLADELQSLAFRKVERIAAYRDAIDRAGDGHGESEVFLRHFLRTVAEAPLDELLAVSEAIAERRERELRNGRSSS